MKKGTKWIVVVIVCALVILGPGKDLLARFAVENGVRIITGLKLKMDKLRVGLLSTQVDIGGLKLNNPEGFEDEVMVDLPEIFVDYELTPLLTGKIHLKEIVLHLKEFSVVKNKEGVVNLDSLKTLQQQKPAKKEEAKPAEKEQELDLQIDSLHLKIEKIFFKDYTKGDEPKIREFSVDIDETYKNITSPNKLVSLILFKAFTGTTIGRVADIDMKALKGTAADALATGKEVVAAAEEKAREAAAQAKEKVGESVEEMKAQSAEKLEESKKAAAETAEKAGEKVSETASAAKEKATSLLKKLPFGKEE